MAADRDEPGSSSTSDSHPDAPEPPEPPPADDRSSTPTIELSSALPELAPVPDIDWLRDQVVRICDAIHAPVHAIGVQLVDDGAMTELHREHCDLDSTTDVLTFPMSGPDEPIDVEIAICVDEAHRQAADRGHTVEQELLLYVLHGLLHVAGHDDHDEAAYQRMHAEEDRILNALGIGATFDRPPTGTARGGEATS
ncbi:MAG: rRNA maturation RNase YbeY [Planctomycetota bacterium]